MNIIERLPQFRGTGLEFRPAVMACSRRKASPRLALRNRAQTVCLAAANPARQSALVVFASACLLGLTIWLSPIVLGGEPAPKTVEYFGLCDASAAAAVDATHFLVASDEDSILRLYRVDKLDGPEQVFDLTEFLRVDAKKPETDIEAAARIGERVYWITSHGRNAKGRARGSRDRFFATTLGTRGGQVSVEPVGRPYQHLLADLEADPRLARYELRSGARKAPEDEAALSIEGLCATPEGQLLIGFRNPVPHSRALVVPLLNPADTVLGQRARLGEPIELDLGGLGVRDLALAQDKYLIVGGPSDGHGRFRLFLWDGGGAPPKRLARAQLKELHPEAVIVHPATGLREFQILSDDGSRLVDGCECKGLKDPSRQRFRCLWVKGHI